MSPLDDPVFNVDISEILSFDTIKDKPEILHQDSVIKDLSILLVYDGKKTIQSHDQLSKKQLKQAEKENRFAKIEDGKLLVHEKHQNTLNKTDKIKFKITGEKGEIKSFELSSRDIKIIGLSESEYEARISILARQIINQRSLENKKRTEKSVKREDNWYQNSNENERVKIDIKGDFKKYNKIFRKALENIKFQEMINQTNRDIKKRERDKEEFRKVIADTKERITEIKDENRKEDVKKKLGLPPNLRSLEEIAKYRRKRKK